MKEREERGEAELAFFTRLYAAKPRFVQTKARQEAFSTCICISFRCCCVGVLYYVGKCNTPMIPSSKFSRCFDASPG